MADNFDDADAATDRFPLFSIIVPVFNTEAYLETCLRSAMVQSEEDIEIIVVDDGSTDSSGALAAQLAASDTRIRILRQENAGQGMARNQGLNKARGTYVLFLDSDDTLDPNACRIVAREFARTDAQIVSFGLQFHSEEGKLVASRSIRHAFVSHQPDIFKDAMLDRNFLTSPCNKAYDRMLLLRNGIRFPPLRAYEDSLFSRHVAYHAERVAYIPDILYRALTRSGSTTRRMSFQSFEIAADLIGRERKLFVGEPTNKLDESVFGAHVVRFFTHILLLAAFRIDDSQERDQCYRLANAAGFSRYASRDDVRKHLPTRSKIQLLLAARPTLARWAALFATQLRIVAY